MMSGASQGIKIVSEANLSCAASQPDILARRTFVNLDTAGWSGGLATVLPQDMGSGGGAGPLKEELDLEEEEKRRVRRERNNRKRNQFHQRPRHQHVATALVLLK